MAHKTLIGGTAYEIGGGKTLVGGTAYSIDKGKTLVGGTAYEIAFSFSVTVNITGGGRLGSCFASINSTAYTSDQTLEIESGTEIYLYAEGKRLSGSILLNGTEVGVVEGGKSVSYTFVPDASTVNIKLAYGSNGSSITITTS